MTAAFGPLPWLLFALPAVAAAQDRRGMAAELRHGAPTFQTAVPDHLFDVVLGRPTATSIAVSVLARAEREAVVEFAPVGGSPRRTAPVTLPAGEPVTIDLRELQPDRPYRYRLLLRGKGEATPAPTEERGFHTARPPGAPFVFTVQADPHLDENTSLPLYERTLQNALADAPDFHVDLGDTFMVDKFKKDHREALPMYLAQRYWFGRLCHSAPLFFAVGNHDGECGFWRTGRDDDVALWSNRMRRRYLPNPEPDGFYSGNEERVDGQRLQDYYAFTWGDAQFVVLDPYWYSTDRRGKDGWRWTLGAVQHRWLANVLAQARPRFCFVFVHQLVGGQDQNGRGGVTAVPLGEWGGHDTDGRDVFAARRPGFERPIHELLVRHRVTAVFHGHDHFHAREERDGIVYQLVAQPGHPGDTTRSAAEYGYPGPVLGGAGHLRVHVAPDRAVVEFVRAALPGAGRRSTATNGEVADRYELRPRGPAPAGR